MSAMFFAGPRQNENPCRGLHRPGSFRGTDHNMICQRRLSLWLAHITLGITRTARIILHEERADFQIFDKNVSLENINRWQDYTVHTSNLSNERCITRSLITLNK